jgi:hypothetical protein
MRTHRKSLAKETGRSKSYYAREAIRQYLEDREDYLKGIAALERREPTITLEGLETLRRAFRNASEVESQESCIHPGVSEPARARLVLRCAP